MSLSEYQPPPPYPLEGEVLDGKYQVERILGEGGMGAVAKATHLLRRAPVALKFMSPAVMSLPGAVERFINEGVAASQIDSDHVVKVYDVGRLPTGAPFLVMEFLTGSDLADILLRDGRPGLEIARAVHFTLQTLRGLQTAHAAGIIHRDIKPANCFVIEKEGEPDFIKLVDFGISKVQQGGAHMTRTNSALGTPLYMSPEQARSPRDVDLRSDLYAVGVVLYELLTGQTPFHSDSGEFTEILYKIFTADPPPVQSLRPDIPDGLARAIHRALLREPAQRYASTAEMGEALAPWADGRSYQVLMRLRGTVGRRPSNPPAMSSGPFAVISRGGTMTPSDALARTIGTNAGGGFGPPAASLAVPSRRRFVLAISAVVLGVAMLGAGVLAVRARSRTVPTAVSAPATSIPTVLSAPSTASGPPMPSPTPTPTPSAIVSTAPSAIATPSVSASVFQRPRPQPGPTPTAVRPGNLGGLRPVE
jgi:serine/threonine-protein kinase